jgi:c-di-GMP phosphodiesterase
MENLPFMLARQPILTVESKVYGYELLYRGSLTGVNGSGTGRTGRVVAEAIGNWDTETLVGGGYMFVNFDQELLESDFSSVLPAGRGVVEILETVQATPRVLQTLDALRRGGIGIAIDDFLFQDNATPFLDYVDYVKVDVLAAGDGLGDIVHRLKSCRARLVAEKVETRQQFASCRSLGFDLFQGYFFARPEILQPQPITLSQASVVALISELQNPGEAVELAEKISCDVSLAHQILKLANSAAFRRRRAVTSIRDAVILLGVDIIRQWAAILLLTRLGDGRPHELLSLALIRGRLCQSLGAKRREPEPGELFTVGLLSVLDALCGRPMNTLVEELPLSADMQAALCGCRDSALGDTLHCAMAYESGDFSALASLSAPDQQSVVDAYSNALRFVRDTFGAAA